MFYVAKNSETGSQVTRPGDTERLCTCQCSPKRLDARNFDGNGSICMYMQNPPGRLHNCHSPTMLEEQQDPGASLVCIHMNVGRQSPPCVCVGSCKPRYGSGDTFIQPASGSAGRHLSPARGRKNRPDRCRCVSSPSHPKSVPSTSSASECGHPPSDPESSKTKTSGTDTGSSCSKDQLASPRPSILRDKQTSTQTSRRTKSRPRRSKSRSSSGSSRSGSSTSTTAERKGKSKRHKRHKKTKPGTQSPRLKKKRVKDRRSGKSRESDRPKSVKKRRRSRRSGSLSPSRKASSSSGASSESSRSSVTWEPEFQERKAKRSSRKSSRRSTGVISSERETTETEPSSGSRENKRQDEYLQDNLQEPQLCPVEFDCEKQPCKSCQRMRQQSNCVCNGCVGMNNRLPSCLVCSRCYIIPCTSSEHLRKVVASDCCAKSSCKTKSHKRDRHSSKRSHKQKQRRHGDRENSGEWTQNHADTYSESIHSSGGKHSCSSGKDTTSTNRRSQFYQCDLLLGQCSTPTQGEVSAPL